MAVSVSFWLFAAAGKRFHLGTYLIRRHGKRRDPIIVRDRRICAVLPQQTNDCEYCTRNLRRKLQCSVDQALVHVRHDCNAMKRNITVGAASVDLSATLYQQL